MLESLVLTDADGLVVSHPSLLTTAASGAGSPVGAHREGHGRSRGRNRAERSHGRHGEGGGGGEERVRERARGAWAERGRNEPQKVRDEELTQ